MLNPFAGYGKTISGDRIIGRLQIIDLLVSRMQGPAGSLSLVGQPRVGKSTVICEAQTIVKRLSPKIPVIYLDIGTVSEPAQVFDTMIEEILEEVESQQLVDYKLITEILNYPHATDYDSFRRCKRGLKKLAAQGVNSVVIFDDFDSIRNIASASLLIQRIRDLLYRPVQFGLTGIILSRRPLSSIETMINDVSVLFGICECQYLQPLPKASLASFADRCGTLWRPTDLELEDIWWQTGGHPFLTEMILCHSWDQRSIPGGIEECQSQVYEYCELLRRQLSDDGLFDQLLQFAIGPMWNISPGSKDRLLRYGLIVEHAASAFEGWSGHFQMYLEKCNREFPIWAEWRETEKTLRAIIEDTLQDKFGEDWIQRISEDSAVKSSLEHCRQLMDSEKSVFGALAQDHVLDFAFPKDLWLIITRYWEQFRGVFGDHPKRYWAERFTLLLKVRNSSAHQREEYVSESDLDLARHYCKELLTTLRKTKG